MKRLWQTELLQEALDLSLLFLIIFKLLVDDLLKFLLNLNLHAADLRRHDVAKLILDSKLTLKVFHDRLKLDKVLCCGGHNLVNRKFFLKIDSLVFVDGLISQLNNICILCVEVILVA